MITNENEYANKVYSFLNSLEPSKWVVIDHICEAENVNTFTNYIKEYINYYPCGWQVEFSSDYKKVRRGNFKGYMPTAILKIPKPTFPVE